MIDQCYPPSRRDARETAWVQDVHERAMERTTGGRAAERRVSMAAIDYRPPMCSERESSDDEDCTWCAGVMLQNAAHARTLARSTRAEYEGLRQAAGLPARVEGDGSNLTELKRGITERYGWTPRITRDAGDTHPAWATILEGLDKVGDAAVLQGLMGVFPRGDHFRRHGPDFDGEHAVYVQRVDEKPHLWWMDPQAPNSFDGEFIELKDAKRFYEALEGGAAFTHIGAEGGKGVDMPGLATTPADDLTMGVVRIPAGTEVINVETRKRVTIVADVATRQAVGPFTRDFGDVKGFFIKHQDPGTPDRDPATYWVSAASCTFTPA